MKAKNNVEILLKMYVRGHPLIKFLWLELDRFFSRLKTSNNSNGYLKNRVVKKRRGIVKQRPLALFVLLKKLSIGKSIKLSIGNKSSCLANSKMQG